MVIDDFHVKRMASFKTKTNAPLVIDTDAVLPASVAPQCFQPIIRRYTKVIQPDGPMKHLQLPLRHNTDVDEAPSRPSGEQCLSVGACE